jgi:small redox-active disulfide protein 2
MRIEILGSGCANCVRLEANAREAVAKTGLQADVVKVTDYAAIASYGILATPGLVIDGQVVSYGRVPSTAEVEALLLGS